MNIKIQVNEHCTLECDAADPKVAFQKIAYLQSIFGVKKCGNCGSTNLRLQHRKAQGKYDYYSVVCDDCGHELKFGQQEATGQLFPKKWEPPFRKQQSQSDDDYSQDTEPEYETADSGSSDW